MADESVQVPLDSVVDMPSRIGFDNEAVPLQVLEVVRSALGCLGCLVHHRGHDQPSEKREDENQREKHDQHGPAPCNPESHQPGDDGLESEGEEEGQQHQGQQLRQLENQMHEPVCEQTAENRHEAQIQG